MDALSTILSSIRLEAGIFSRAALRSPWAVRSGKLPTSVFHVVVRGGGRLEVEGQPVMHWTAGDLLVLPRGDDHVLSAGAELQPRRLSSFPSEPDDDGVPRIVGGGQGEETLLLCGSFRVDPAAAGFLMAPLPAVLHVRPHLDRTVAWLDASLRLLTAEQLHHSPGSAALSARLAEMLFVQVLRDAVPDDPAGTGWLGAVFDPQLGAALAAIHAEPTADWDARTLAKRAGMSRSVFFDRFREIVGESPAAYLTRWRMVLARMALRDGASVQEAADRAGYASPASFTRAFKREVGAAPRAWQRGQQPQPRAGA